MPPLTRRLIGALYTATLLASSAFAADPNGKTIAEIQIEGLKHTKEYVVRRELYSKVGDLYGADHARRDAERLDRLRIFSSVEHKATVRDDGGVGIVIRLEETFPYLPTISLQVSDENGVSAGPGLKSNNMFGRNIELGASAQFGGATNINVYLRDPWVTGNHLSYEVEFFRRERENVLDDFQEISYEPSMRVGSFLGNDGRIGVSGSGVRLAADRDGITLNPDNRDNIVTLGLFAGYDTRDLWSRANSGWLTEVEFQHSTVLGVGASYWTSIFDIQRFFGWGRNNLLLTSLTTLRTGKVGVDVPIHQDFHIGGTNTIRGWSLDSRSGKDQQITTSEYRYMLLEPRSFNVTFFTAYVGLQLAAFGDLGHAWSEKNEFALDRFIGGYGFGIRLLFPFVDEIRIDVAWGEPGQGSTIHFGVFPKALVQRLRVR